MTNKELVFKLKTNKANQDYNAFKTIYKMYYESLVAYVRGLTFNTDEAKDIAQDCFVILWNKRFGLHENSSIKNYLYTLGYNSFVDQYRKNQNKRKAIEELKLEALNNRINEDETTSKTRIKKLNTLIENLPERCKEILILNKRENLKYRDIAQALNISEKTVESQMRIAFNKIRKGFN